MLIKINSNKRTKIELEKYLIKRIYWINICEDRMPCSIEVCSYQVVDLFRKDEIVIDISIISRKRENEQFIYEKKKREKRKICKDV